MDKSDSQDNAEPSNVEDTLVNTTFAGKYEIDSVLGKGGMATVYKAKHKYMERTVAVKVLKRHLVSDPLSVERFKKESKAASVLSHPNIITVFDFGVDENNTAYLVMDYLEGTTLGDIIDENGPLLESDVILTFSQVAKGLIHAHARNVVHRDLKPKNLILTLEDDDSILVQIVDFGIAKMLTPEDQSSTLTRTGEVFGSPIYMSPEQCASEDLDIRSDIYSLGCVMYEALTGLPPFLGKNPMETMSMHVEDEPPAFSEVMPHHQISKKLEKVVFKCLEKHKEDRFESAQEFLEALPRPKENASRIMPDGTRAMTLEQIIAGKSTNIRQALEARPKKRKKIKKDNSRKLAIVFGGTLLLVSLFVCFYPGPAEDPGPPIKKIKWQLLMNLADWQIKNKQYENALPLLDWALADARNLSGKRTNYDKVSETLIKLIKVYSSLGMTVKQQATVDALSEIDKEKWVKRANKYIDELKQAKIYLERLEKKGVDPKNYRNKEPLNIKGDSNAIIALSRRLDLVQEYTVEEDLLELADYLFTKLFGKDYIELADIKLQLAECLRKEDQIQEITELQLYERVLEIQKHNLSVEELEPEKSQGYIRALLKLGQWQRDRSHFQDAKVNLTRAISLAQKSEVIGEAELREFYSSYADFLRQVGKDQEAASYEAKAKNLKGKHNAAEK